jgi:hypothetical protein
MLLKRKIIKKLRRFLFWTLGLIFLLLVSVILVLQVDSVQTFLARRATSYLSSELKADISIKRLSFRLVKSVILQGVLIKDQHNDTLLYVDELNVSISSFSTQKHTMKIGRLTLNDATFNLNRYKGEEHDNLHFLTEYFASSDTTASTPWNIVVKGISLSNLHFRRLIEDDTTHINGVNFSNLDVSSIYGDFDNFHTSKDTIFTEIDRLRFREKSGLVINEFSGKAKVCGTQIAVDHLVIKSPYTDLHTDLVFQFDSFACFDEFTHQIHWKSDFDHSTISFKDIAYFTEDLWGMNDSLKIDGNFKGTVNHFKGKNVTLQWGSQSFFKGNISMNGLPEIEDTYIELTADEIRSSKKDVESIPLPPFDSNNHIMLPENLTPLGIVSFKGRFNGFYNDFVAYGTINSDLGLIASDLNVKYNRNTKSTAYSGHLSSTRFDAGVIAKIPDLGKVTLSLDVKGAGLKFDNVNAVISGNVEALEFKNYTYRGIKVDGQFAKKLFNGSLNVNEPNVDFDFLGTINFQKQLPEFNFTANIRHAQLDTLNLFKLNGENVLETYITTSFKGNRPDNIVGDIEIKNTNFRAGKKMYHINSIKIDSETDLGSRTVDIVSDNLDAHCKGVFEFATIGDAFKEILPRYLPSLILPKKSFQSNQNFTYDIRLKNLNVITENFLPSWDFAPNTTLIGHFNSVMYDFELKLNTPYVKYKSLTFENMSIKADANRTQMDLDVKSDRISGKDSVSLIEIPEIRAIAQNNEVNYAIHLADIDTFTNHARLLGKMKFETASKFTFKVDSSNLVVEHAEWKLDPNNLITFDTSLIAVDRLHFQKGQESIQLDGRISKDPTEKMNISLNNFGLDHVNTIAKLEDDLLGGIINGKVHLSDVYHKLQLETDLTISNLTVDKDTIGNVSIQSAYNTEKEILTSTVSAIKGTAKIIDISGQYFLSKEEDNIDYSIQLNNLYLHPVEKYVSDIFTNMYGRVNANLHLTGTFNKPLFNGTLGVNKASLLVNYLGTHYSFNSEAAVRNNTIILDAVKVNDDNNNQAELNGTISHKFFHDFRFDVEMTADRFQVLKTTAKDNSLYYGIANASGYAHFYGPIDNMNMDISLLPEKGTVINIPLNTASDLSRSEYITFIDRSKDPASNAQLNNQVDLSGVKLNMNLDMNRNALMNIIFDEKIGDVISGSGTGSLKLDINTAGNFNMYGTYTIEKGDYLFTLQNLINKKFTIDNGSRITWAGDPYEANVDISATYIVNTSSLYNLLADSTYKRRLPVECRLFLTNKLMNPTINYEITVRGLDPTGEALVKSILNSEQEINKQMFGLLVLNQFVPQSGAGQVGRLDAGAGAGASASELLSNQVSNWLGQLSKDVNIGFNYRAKDTYSSEEFQVILSKSLFNDRLTFEGNVGYLSSTQSYASSSVVGDFNAEYKVSEDGRFRIKGFNRSNADNIISYSQSPYTQGFGVFYRKDFNEIGDLFRRHRAEEKAKEAEKAKEPEKVNP